VHNYPGTERRGYAKGDEETKMSEPSFAQKVRVDRTRSMLSVSELNRRPTRDPDYSAESRALVALTHEMAVSPDTILHKLAETALELCGAHSAGLSLLEEADQKKRFHWRVIVGAWEHNLNGGTPRDFGPCGTVLDQNAALICRRPEQDFPYWNDVQPPLDEGLLIPFYVNGEAIRTLWVIAHDESRRFDREDLRLMTSLGAFTGAAYQTWLSVDSARRLAALVENSDDAILGVTLDGFITSWNRGAERLYGYSSDEAVGKSIMIVIPAGRQDDERKVLERIRNGERVVSYETVRRGKDGGKIEVSLTISPVVNNEGTIIGASKIARDVSERKRTERQMALLAREAEHRAKNILATVLATVNLSQSETVDGLKQAIVGRLQALASVHRLFIDSRWTGADLRSIASEELAPYRESDASRAQIDGDRILLDPPLAQTVAVVFHELATNAAKYGALSVPEGKVRIDWSRAGDGRLHVCWSESGGPVVTPSGRRGFGMRVMESKVRSHSDANLKFDWRPRGLHCELVLAPEKP
jgi:PAS domain S-box-containing protein